MQFKLKTATRTRDRVVSQHGITPERDNPQSSLRRRFWGRKKQSLPNAPQSCCVAVFCPRLIAAPVERASACNAEQRTIPHPISGIVMLNQNAARPQGTLQPPHYSVRLEFILHSTALTSLPEFRIEAADNGFFISTVMI